MMYKLRLYVTRGAAHAQRAIENLHWICQQELEGACDVEVIDVNEDLERALAEKILATPTLVKCEPLPVRKLIGDLSDAKKVLQALGLAPEACEATPVEDSAT